MGPIIQVVSICLGIYGLICLRLKRGAIGIIDSQEFIYNNLDKNLEIYVIIAYIVIMLKDINKYIRLYNIYEKLDIEWVSVLDIIAIGAIVIKLGIAAIVLLITVMCLSESIRFVIYIRKNKYDSSRKRLIIHILIIILQIFLFVPSIAESMTSGLEIIRLLFWR